MRIKGLSERCQTSKVECSVKFAKRFVLDNWQGSEYTSADYDTIMGNEIFIKDHMMSRDFP